MHDSFSRIAMARGVGRGCFRAAPGWMRWLMGQARWRLDSFRSWQQRHPVPQDRTTLCEATGVHVHHGELIDAVDADDAELARRLMTMHIEEILAIARAGAGSTEGTTT